MLVVMLKVMWRVGAEPRIEPRASPPSLGLFPLQEASLCSSQQFGGFSLAKKGPSWAKQPELKHTITFCLLFGDSYILVGHLPLL